MAHYHVGHDVILLMTMFQVDGTRTRRRVFIYDIQAGRWLDRSLPDAFNDQAHINAFYDRRLGVHFFHIGQDARYTGKMWAFKYSG